MTLSRAIITVFLVLSVAVWGLVLLVQHTALDSTQLAPFGIVLTVLGLCGTTLERVLWRLPWLHGWLVRRPDLRGTWLVQLTPESGAAQTAAEVPGITCYAGVVQTLSKLQLHLMTPESESWFIADGIRPSPSGMGYQVVGVYTNLNPKIVDGGFQGADVSEGPSA